MSHLGRIEAKLDELVKAKKAEETEKQPTQEEKDEERLREIEERMTDLIELLNTGTTRESADAKIDEHRERVKSGKGEPRPLLKVYHEHKGKKIPTTRRTQAMLEDKLIECLGLLIYFLLFAATCVAATIVYDAVAYQFEPWYDARRASSCSPTP